VKQIKHPSTLPIGPAARVAFEIEEMRADCCKAARYLTTRKVLNEAELDECARLDEALDRAHRIIKHAVREVMLSRLERRSQVTRAS
jgi:hypothetical protein